ncbi:MAG: hypothetical protein SRB1_01181 [Desulfobacteraceae bacterium Eth-SRB1]|nr:MAG: hypothetical protein SRB1_01181 [Desulfobacteraceae bacterium Eth-SRB1]
MEHTRPDRTADGIRELMVGVADTYALTHKKYITFGSLIRKSSLHRLSLEKYIDEAIKQDLLRRDNQLIHVTNKGREYLFAHKIIDA